MSYNQSRPEKSDTQYRQKGRSASFNQQRPSSGSYGRGAGSGAYGRGSGPGAYGRGTGSGVVPSPSISSPSMFSNRSFKKSDNVQGGQSSANLPPVNLSNSNGVPSSRNLHNDVHIHQQSPGASVLPVVSSSSNPTESSSSQRSNRAIPKPPAAQSTTVTADENEPKTPAKVPVPGDTSKGFAFQFGSLSPGFMNGMQIPARTSSAPPNLDEQKLDQARHDSLMSAHNLSGAAPKNHVTSKDVNYSAHKDSYQTSTEKRDPRIPSAHLTNQAHKSPATSVRKNSMQTQYQPSQASSVQFGGPNLHIQSHNVTASSLQMQMPMPMPMPIPMGNAQQMQQQVFVPGLQSHPMPHHGIMLQAQGMSFPAPVGIQLNPQLGHMGMGMSSQYPQKQGGKFGVPRNTTVKITHPDTHEELRLDKRVESGSSVPKSQTNMPSQAQPVPSFAPSLPVNYFHGSYNPSPAVLPSSSLTSSSSQVAANSQAARFSYPVNQGLPFINPSTPAPPIRSRPLSHSVADSSHLTNTRDPQNAFSSSSSGTTKVTIKPAMVVRKIESPKASWPSGQTNSSLSLKNGSEDSSQELKPGNRHIVSKSFPKERKSNTETSDATSTTPAAMSEGNMPAVVISETKKGDFLNSLDLANDILNEPCKEPDIHPKIEVSGQSNIDSLVPDPGNSISCQTAEDANAKAIVKAVCSDEFKDPPAKALSGVDNVSELNVDGNSQGSSQVSFESGSLHQVEVPECNSEGKDSDNLMPKDDIEEGKSDELSGGHASVYEKVVNNFELKSNLKMEIVKNGPSNFKTEKGVIDGAANVDPGMKKMVDITDTHSAAISESIDLQSPNVPSDSSEASLINGEAESSDPATTVSKDTSLFESNISKTTCSGKKKKRELLQKADAAGTTFDLYMAYKGPEEKKEVTLPLESPKDASTLANKQPATVDNIEAKTVTTKEVKQNKAELEDWEDAADVSTLESPHDAGNHQGKSSSDLKYELGNMEKKYSRDFLLKFVDQCTYLPVGFEILPEIADALMSVNVGETDHNSYSGSGRAVDRQASGFRTDRRGSTVSVDDRWMKSPGPFGQGRDLRMDIGHAGNVGFRPGQGGNSGVLRNPHAQSPIISRVAQSMGPVGGIGRNSSNERWQRAAGFHQKGLIPSPHTPLQMMHRAERKYEVGKVSDEEEAKQRRLKAILNKLTPQNFEKLFEQVKEVNIDNPDTLTGVISQIFDKALMEPTFCEMYANLCFHLSQVMPDFTENNEKITFKRLLLNKCQEEFERGEREEAEANQVTEGEEKETAQEREEKRLKARRRMLGNIRLIGELYKKKMLTEKIMHECIKKLLGYNQEADEENIEALCKLMSTIGEMIDHSRAKVHIDAYFMRMTELSNDTRLSSRVRFLLRDAIDLRKNKWQQRRKIEGPKKIDEVHRDAAQERQTQTSRLARGPSINLSARRGPADYGSRGGSLLSSPNPQVGKFRGLPQSRGFGAQDMKVDDRTPLEAGTRSVRLPQRSSGDESIALVPQGGLGTGMSMRGPRVASSTPVSDISSAGGDSRRTAAGFNGSGSDRFAASVAYRPSSPQEHRINHVKEDTYSDMSLGASPPMGRSGLSSVQNVPTENVCSEERLHDMAMAAIKEFYSARDEKEIGMCIKDINSPSFHPTMISLWVTDSFERKDVERSLLAKLLVNLVKSPESTLSEAQLIKGFEHVLTTLEDAVNDAPKATEYLGRIFGEAIVEKVVSLGEIGRLILEGGEERGSLVEFGLAGDVLGSAFEIVKSKSGESVFNDLRQSSGLRLEDFKPPKPNRSSTLEKFM